jgi:hypothetical protein
MLLNSFDVLVLKINLKNKNKHFKKYNSILFRHSP